jgi:hypothetical protein
MRLLTDVAPRSRVCGLGLLGLVAIVLTSAIEAADAGRPLKTLRVDDAQALSIETSDVALEEILLEIAQQAGVRMDIQGDLGLAQPQAFEGVPLDEGIRRLVGDNRVNLIMRYEIDNGGRKRLVEVVAHAASEVPDEVLERKRMRTELARVRIPPPPPPPPTQ